MTEAKTASKAAPKSKSQVRRIKAVEDDLKQEFDKIVADVETEIKPVEEKAEKFSVVTLRKMHDDAIMAEDALKRELAVARQRAANASTKISDEADHAIIVLKAKIAEAEGTVKELESKLAGEVKDIWGTKF